MPFDQELLQLARGAAGTLQRAFLTVVVLTAIAGAAAGLWALRPVPSFSSEDVAEGSPFDVTFKIRNGNAWLPLSNLKIWCVLAQVRAVAIPPTAVDATNLQLPGTDESGLRPGEAGTFTCPFRTVLEQSTFDDAGTARRAEIYFRSEYDLPLVGSPRLTHNSPHFVLDTHLLPPRWTRKR